jgi:hypothetical protein
MSKARFPPLSDRKIVNCRPCRITLRTRVGEVEVEAFYGQDPTTGRNLCPMRERWNLGPRQTMSPVLVEQRLCFTATMTGSYEAAAQVAGQWGVEADDATIHQHVQRVGGRAETARIERVERALSPQTRCEVIAEAQADLPKEKFSLVIMMDGWMGRERGPDWGLKPPEKEGSRVEWHEMKSAIIFRLDQRAGTQTDRRVILEKFYEVYQGEPFEFGRRVYAQALRRGLNQAQRVYVVADGGAWIWNIVDDRFEHAIGVLDFYHASEHLWAVARQLYPDDEVAARKWVGPVLHDLKHGGEEKVLRKLENILSRCVRREKQCAGELGKELNYLKNHREHLHDEKVEKQGRPKGSGAMESTCSQFQNRFKRTGQFWTRPGMDQLLALELARRNGDWEELWLMAA